MIETIVGLEIHTQLKTQTKAFCSCTNAYGDEPNVNVCPICLGLPGGVPTLNKKVVDHAILVGTALNCTINTSSTIDRKKYFYPDLPKGYQITQDEVPICENGYLELDSGKKIRIQRIHIEEDTGRTLHQDNGSTYLDYNRAGIPLVEIVTYPDISSGEEAREFLNKLRSIITYLDVSDGRMEEGSLRCDVNVNIKDTESNDTTSIIELKNLNSFSAVERGIKSEVSRQKQYLNNSDKEVSSTRRWDDSEGRSILMREKIGPDNYRYTPDFDMPDLLIDDNYISKIQDSMPELIEKKYLRFIKEYKLDEYNAEVITSSRPLSDYFEKLAKNIDNTVFLSNFIINDLLRRVEIEEFDSHSFKFKDEDLINLLKYFESDKINDSTFRKVFRYMFEDGIEPIKYIEENNLIQITDDSFIDQLVADVISDHPDTIEEYLSGRDRVLGFLIGQVMKQSKGKANPQLVSQKLISEINKHK